MPCGWCLGPRKKSAVPRADEQASTGDVVLRAGCYELTLPSLGMADVGSVYVVPGLASEAECAALIATTSQHRVRDRDLSTFGDFPAFRMSVVEQLDADALVLCDRVIRNTLLTVEQELPDLALSTFGQQGAYRMHGQ